VTRDTPQAPYTVRERQRLGTLYFLDYLFAPQRSVFIDTEVDMTAVVAHRTAARASLRRYSYVSYVLHGAGRALARYPEANAAPVGRLRPRVVRFRTVSAKLALDKTLDGRRLVLSAILPEVHRSSLDTIQGQVDEYRDSDPDTLPAFAGVRRLASLPVALGRLSFRALLARTAARPKVLGTFSVSSLGHGPVDTMFGPGGTAVTFGVGRVRKVPVVRDGAVAIAPVMRLSMAFDHRVIDGAMAAEILGYLKESLEGFDGDSPEIQPVVHSGAGADRVVPLLVHRP
jgi:pyruvate/2-oxoglutarate dehydrogenase complex dihydrolipoamide acyltransferase (E2) component